MNTESKEIEYFHYDENNHLIVIDVWNHPQNKYLIRWVVFISILLLYLVYLGISSHHFTAPVYILLLFVLYRLALRQVLRNRRKCIKIQENEILINNHKNINLLTSNLRIVIKTIHVTNTRLQKNSEAYFLINYGKIEEKIYLVGSCRTKLLLELAKFITSKIEGTEFIHIEFDNI